MESHTWQWRSYRSIIGHGRL